ncbi:putative protein arginine N-methyltransferase 1.2 [Sarracenia purpurea var. burkii]
MEKKDCTAVHALHQLATQTPQFSGPKSRATHWKQTVLYLEDVLTICEGEALVGSMTVSQNKKNPRDVDIMIKYSLNGRRCLVSRTQYFRMR